MADSAPPQVALFGSIVGEWREEHIIPLLDELGVTYFHPGQQGSPWTEEMGRHEAQVMARAETVVMVFLHYTPAFGGLAEAGWAAARAVQRGQTFILYVPGGFVLDVPGWFRHVPIVRMLVKVIEENANRARFLVSEHARQLAAECEHIIVADSLDAVVEALRQRYEAGGEMREQAAGGR